MNASDQRGAPGFPSRDSRVYKTGDLLRYNDDGSLTSIGRKDGMVKIRGQRVELGAVEYHAKCLILAEVACCSVVAEIITPQKSQARILALFLSLQQVANIEDRHQVIRKVTKVLEDNLPDRLLQYIVSGAYIPLEVIPTTTTNKIDRRTLRELGGKQNLEDLARLQAQSSRRNAPTTQTEKALQALWASILGIEASSITADSSLLRIGSGIDIREALSGRCNATIDHLHSG